MVISKIEFKLRKVQAKLFYRGIVLIKSVYIVWS